MSFVWYIIDVDFKMFKLLELLEVFKISVVCKILGSHVTDYVTRDHVTCLDQSNARKKERRHVVLKVTNVGNCRKMSDIKII